MFVDVGSQKDGLLHIKDVSRDYFIQDLESRFIPGQDVDVYVKFVECDSKKLGLQLYPVEKRFKTDSSFTTRIGVSELITGSLINGKSSVDYNMKYLIIKNIYSLRI